jgi:hypothetical protein
MREKSLVEKFLENQGTQIEHYQEMAAVGEIKNPKAGHFYLEVFSREYKNKTPHVTLELPQKPKKIPVAKIKIPKEQPKINTEPEFIWIKEGFIISNFLKKEIQKWFATQNGKMTGWERASEFWNGQAQAISWGQISK